MAIDVNKLFQDMAKAAAGVLQAKWPLARDYADNEFRKLLKEANHIAQLKDDGKITEQEACYLMELQRNAARIVLLAVEGLGLVEQPSMLQ